MDVLGTALSGMRAAEKRLEVSADNVANSTTEGAKAKTTNARSAENGGVIVDVSFRDPATVTVPSTDGRGTVELPNTSLDQEAVTQIQATTAFKANVNVIKAQKEMDQSLLDIQA